MKVDRLEEVEGEDAPEATETGAAEEVVDGQLALIEVEESEAEPEESADAEDAEAGQDADEDAEAAAEKPKKASKPKKSKKSGKAGKSIKAPGKPRAERPRRSAPLWSVVALAVLVVALAAGTFVLRRGASETLSRDEIDKAVRTAAATAQHISSWDYRTIDSDTKQVLGETTGDFREAYEKSAAKLLQSAPEQQAVTVGLTSKAGVESVSKGQVKVLVFLNQQTTKKDSDAHIEQHRLLLTMVQKDGEWLVSKLDVLG